MELMLFFCALLCLIQVGVSRSASLEGLSYDRMVSDGWSHDILTDDWNTVPRGCDSKPADVYFLVDTAGDTSKAVLQEQKRYLNDLAALFYLRRSTTRLGVVTYGHTPVITSPLKTGVSLQQVQAAVHKTPRVGGHRRTAQALKFIRHNAFSPLVARREVAHVVILLTNGFSADAKQTAREAALLRKQGVYVYTVSLSTSGGRVDKGELTDMASLPSDKFVFTSDSWNIVGSLIELLHIRECDYQVMPPVSGKQTMCSTRRPTQLAFAVEHLGLGSPKSQRIVSFIQDLLAEVDPDSNIKAAILTSRDPISRYALTRRADTIKLLEEKLGWVVFPELSHLLRRAGKVLARTARRGDYIDSNDTKKKLDEGQKVLLVFMDDSVKISKKALMAAKANSRNKVDTYVLYVGEDSHAKQRMKELGQVASGQDHVIVVPSYASLHWWSTLVDTLSTVCKGL